MGLIKAASAAVKGVLADQWKEFFYCDSLSTDLLMVKGEKRVSGKSSNTNGEDNIISNGSGIAVADGQCMIIVEQGRVVELCAEPGEFTYDSSSEPSIFAGKLGESVVATFKTAWNRFAHGGDTAKDQRVYYFNVKEIMDNKFGTATPIPFRVVDRNIGLDIDVSVRCNGVYSYKIVDPLLFYKNVCGNVEGAFYRSQIESQLKAEFVDALQPSIGGLSALEIRPSAIPSHVNTLKDNVNKALAEKWASLRGLSVTSIALNPITLPPADEEMIKKAQQTAIYRDPSMGAAVMVGAQADAMRAAAANENGAMMGFMGMGMAMNAGGLNANDLYNMGGKSAAPAPVNAPAAAGWQCACGQINSGKFCESCGTKKPEAGWQCACGHMNNGNFCAECGAKKPEATGRCKKCGWAAADPANQPKFCPECGEKF